MAFFRYIIFFQVVLVFADKNTTGKFKHCNVASMKQDREIVFSGFTSKRGAPDEKPLKKIVQLTCRCKSSNDELISKALSSIKFACGEDICVGTEEFRNSVIKEVIKKVKRSLFTNWLYLGSKNPEPRNSNDS